MAGRCSPPSRGPRYRVVFCGPPRKGFRPNFYLRSEAGERGNLAMTRNRPERGDPRETTNAPGCLGARHLYLYPALRRAPGPTPLMTPHPPQLFLPLLSLCECVCDVTVDRG